MELIIWFLELENSLLELDMMHKEIAFDMIEIRMNYFIAFQYTCDVFQSLIVFILNLQYSDL